MSSFIIKIQANQSTWQQPVPRGAAVSYRNQQHGRNTCLISHIAWQNPFLYIILLHSCLSLSSVSVGMSTFTLLTTQVSDICGLQGGVWCCGWLNPNFPRKGLRRRQSSASRANTALSTSKRLNLSSLRTPRAVLCYTAFHPTTAV